MDDTLDKYFYRSYSNRSAGRLRSGRWHRGHRPLTENALLREFDHHRIRENKQPTALVSVTDRPIEALHRALAEYYDTNEDPVSIWIVIIRVPDAGNNDGPHHARRLAQRYLDADAFKHEYVFEWEIPQRYVEHRVSVKTLLDRGIETKIDLGFRDFRSTRNALIKEIRDSDDAYGTGHLLGSLAQAFGTGAYTYEIAFHTLYNCLSVGNVDEIQQYIHFDRVGLGRSLDFSVVRFIKLGIQDELD